MTVAALIAGMNVDGSRRSSSSGCSASASSSTSLAALWACGLAMFLRTEQAGALIQMPVFIVLFLAPGVRAAGAAHRLDPRRRQFNPATVVLEAGRGLFAGSPVKVALAFALLAGSVVVLAVFARRGLASAERAG